jgi:hypothetical protein
MEQELSAFAMGVVVAALAGGELSASGAADGTYLTMGDSCSASADLSDHQAASSLSVFSGSLARVAVSVLGCVIDVPLGGRSFRGNRWRFHPVCAA